jgi:tetratricopeptide (TPR) repeat protein
MNADEPASRRKVRQELDLKRATSLLLDPSWPDDARRVIRLKIQAHPFLRERQFDRALQILRSDPSLGNHPYWLSALAHVLEAAGRWADLIPIRLRLLEFSPDWHESWLDLARAVAGRDGHAAALKILHEGAGSAAEDPHDHFIYQLEICRVACLCGDLETARLTAQKLHDSSGDSAVAFFSCDEFEPLWPDYPAARALHEARKSDPDEEPPDEVFPEQGFL